MEQPGRFVRMVGSSCHSLAHRSGESPWNRVTAIRYANTSWPVSRAIFVSKCFGPFGTPQFPEVMPCWSFLRSGVLPKFSEFLPRIESPEPLFQFHVERVPDRFPPPRVRPKRPERRLVEEVDHLQAEQLPRRSRAFSVPTDPSCERRSRETCAVRARVFMDSSRRQALATHGQRFRPSWRFRAARARPVRDASRAFPPGEEKVPASEPFFASVGSAQH